MDKGLKYKEAIDYLDTLNLKLPSELKEMNIEEIRENQLQKAEENLNDKKSKLKNSAQIINFQGKYSYKNNTIKYTNDRGVNWNTVVFKDGMISMISMITFVSTWSKKIITQLINEEIKYFTLALISFFQLIEF